MPELPEVEVARRNLARWSEGRRVVAASPVDPAVVRDALATDPARAVPDAADRLSRLVGRVCTGLTRHGKRLGWRFGDVGLLAHLGMTGKWVRRVGDEAPRHGRLSLTLDDGATLWFVDPRRFGCVVVVSEADLMPGLRVGHGPDALEEPLTPDELAARCRTRVPIKVALLDQARVAGLGNIQAVEALYRAGIDPRTPSAAVDASGWERLAPAIVAQLRHTLAFTQADEVVYMSDGAVDNPFEVYGRHGQPCRRCGDAIRSVTLSGRVTSWCPSCQPEP